MRQRKVPMRKCVVTGEMKPKKEMVRIVKNKEGEVAVDPSGKMNGRGAYVSLDPDVVQKSWNQHILDRTLSTELSDEFYEELLQYVQHQKARENL